MARLFGLFGKKDPNEEDFYLDSDEAKTWGDIDYMRRPQEVKKTFPKIFAGKEVKPPKITPKASFNNANEYGATRPGFSSPLTQAAMSNTTSSNDSDNGSASDSSSTEFTSPLTESTMGTSNGSDNTSTQPANSTPAPSEPTEQRSVDSSMDMFRNMARNINKR